LLYKHPTAIQEKKRRREEGKKRRREEAKKRRNEQDEEKTHIRNTPTVELDHRWNKCYVVFVCRVLKCGAVRT